MLFDQLWRATRLLARAFRARQRIAARSSAGRSLSERSLAPTARRHPPAGRVALAALLVLSLLFGTAEAAGLGLTLQQADSGQFPNVRLSVSVADSQGVPITGLDKDAFEVMEDDKPVSGLIVEPLIDSMEPIAVALAVDVSGSMGDEGKLESAKAATTAFFDTMGTKDGAALVAFADDVKIVQPYTSDKEQLKAAAGKLVARGDTALYDSVSQSALLLGTLQPKRRVIILLTDGEDTTSKQTVDSAAQAASDSGAVIFAIGLGKGVKKDVLDKLASATMGQAIYVSAPDQLRQAFLSFGDQLRRQYVVQYTSKLAPDEKKHNISVKAKYRGQEASVKGTFVARRVALGLDVKGLVDVSQVLGTKQIDVTITAGVARQVELVVDDQVRASVTAAPYTFQWDSTKEKRGIHKVVLRVNDGLGGSAVKEFAVEVVLPTPTLTPTKVPTPVPSSTPLPPSATPTSTPTPTPVPTPAASGGFSPLPAVFGLAVVAGAGGLFVARRRRRSALPPRRPARKSVARPARKPAATSAPDVVGQQSRPTPASTAPPEESTNSIPARQRPRLRVAYQGFEREIPLLLVPEDQVGGLTVESSEVQDADGAAEEPGLTEVVIGREPTSQVVIRDPLASRRHARIYIADGVAWVEDLKSLHGTRVNGDLIDSPRALADNDQIRIGDAVITYLHG